MSTTDRHGELEREAQRAAVALATVAGAQDTRERCEFLNECATVLDRCAAALADPLEGFVVELTAPPTTLRRCCGPFPDEDEAGRFAASCRPEFVARVLVLDAPHDPGGSS